jgi:acetyl esterase
MTTRSPRPRPVADVHPVAEVHLRGRAGPLATRVHWPPRPGPPFRPALLVFLPGDGPGDGAEALGNADALCGALCRHAGVVVLAVRRRRASAGVEAPAIEDGITATAWAADHAAELGADPRRLVVAGEALGAGVAAAVALHARDLGWPVLTRQVLIRPDMSAARIVGSSADPGPRAMPLEERPLEGVAPATVVVAGDTRVRLDDGRRYAALLRHAGVEVEELRDGGNPHGDGAPPGGPGTERLAGDVTRSLRRSLDAPPAERAPHGEVPA